MEEGKALLLSLTVLLFDSPIEACQSLQMALLMSTGTSYVKNVLGRKARTTEQFALEPVPAEDTLLASGLHSKPEAWWVRITHLM